MRIAGATGALAKPHVYAWEKEYRTGRGRWRGTTNFELKLPAGSKVLEVGCGNGKHLSALLGKGYGVYAIDISPSAVKLSQERAKFLNGEAKISVGDACRMDFKANFFDAVFLFHVIGHLAKADRTQAVGEAFRVLKKGGTCFFKGFEHSDLRCGKGIYVEPGTYRKGTNVWVHYFSQGEVRELFESAGFATKETKVEKWNVDFRGTSYTRAEVQAEFTKPR